MSGEDSSLSFIVSGGDGSKTGLRMQEWSKTDPIILFLKFLWFIGHLTKKLKKVQKIFTLTFYKMIQYTP